MLVRAYEPLDRPPVWVEHEGRWYRGRLHAWYRTPSGWVAICTWHVGVGLQLYQDVPEARLKPGDEADPNPAEDEAAPGAPWLSDQAPSTGPAADS